jgi:hypothetical protein
MKEGRKEGRNQGRNKGRKEGTYFMAYRAKFVTASIRCRRRFNGPYIPVHNNTQSIQYKTFSQ